MASNSESGSSDHGNNPELPSSSGIVVERLPAPVIPSETISRIETIVNHIVQDEPEVGAMKLYELTDICRKYVGSKKVLIEKGIQPKLEFIIERTNTCILSSALSVLADLYKEEELAKLLVQKAGMPFVNRVMHLFNHFSVAILQSHCISILTGLTYCPRIRRYMYCLSIGARIFAVLDSCVDQSVQKLTFEFFLLLLNFPDNKMFLSYGRQFSMPCLLSYLDDMCPIIQDLTMQTFLRLSELNADVVHMSLYTHNVILIMFRVVMSTAKSNLHQGAMTMISNNIASKNVCKQLVESKEFERFLEFMDTCADEFAIFSAKVVVRLSEIYELLPVLNDLSAENGICSLMRFSDAAINYNICCFAKNASKHRDMNDRILNEDFLDIILDLVVIPLYPNSFRTMALETIHHFLLRNIRTLPMLFKVDKDLKLQKVFEEEALNEENMECFLRIFQQCCTSVTIRSILDTESFCKRLLQQFKETTTTVGAFDVIRQFTRSEYFLHNFVRWNGPKAVVARLKKTISHEFIREILAFILDSLALESVCFDYINEKLHICLDDMPICFRRMMVVNKILDRMYNTHLPLKFHRKNRIEIEDDLDNGFYCITGVWQGELPLLNDLLRDPITDQFTVFVVDYTGNLGHADSYLRHALRRPRKHRRAMKDVEREYVAVKPSLPTIPEDSELEVVTYRSVKVPNPVYYTNISLDPNMPTLVESAGRRMDRMRNTFSVSEMILALARFIEHHTTGPDAELPSGDSIQQYLDHIRTLKTKYNSNVIPLGCVKRGRGIERAILFKALADRVGILSSLVRGANGFIWNEVPMNMAADEYFLYDKTSVTFGIVDLVYNVGHLMVAGSKEADNYCGVKSYVRFLPKKAPYLRSK